MNIAEYDWCQAVIKDCTCNDDTDCDCIDEALHAPSPTAATEFDDWDGDPVEGQTACGIGRRLIIPGPFSRMGCQRCPQCCELTGMPPGKGSPKNDDFCRQLLCEAVETPQAMKCICAGQGGCTYSSDCPIHDETVDVTDPHWRKRYDAHIEAQRRVKERLGW